MTQETDGKRETVGSEPGTIDELISYVTAKLEAIGFLETGDRDAMGQRILHGKTKESEWIRLAETSIRREEENDKAPSN